MKVLRTCLFVSYIMVSVMLAVWLYGNSGENCIVRPGERIIVPADANGAYFVMGVDGAEFLVAADGGRFRLGEDMTDNYTPPPVSHWIHETLLVLIGMLVGWYPLLLLADKRRQVQQTAQIGTWRREPGGVWVSTRH